MSRYQGLSHQQLYDLLHAGRNGQVNTVSDKWSQMRDIANHLGATLDAELKALGRTWTGEAGIEFQRRLSAVVQFSSTVSGEFAQIETATGVMATQLHEAQQAAEPPSATDGNDHMVQQATSNMAKFSAFGAPISVAAGIVGAIDGHNQDEEARQRAHQRMVNLVADLAAEYDQTANTSLKTDLPAPPAALPGASEGGLVGAIVAGVIGAARAAALAIGGAVTTNAAHVASSSGHAAVTLHAPTPDQHGGTGPLGDGAVAGGHAAPAHSGHGGLDISGGALLAGGGGLTVGLGLAARTAMNSVPSGTTGAAGANFGTRTNPAADPVLGREPDPNAAANSRAGQAAARSATGIAQGRASQNEPEEHENWLTEDDMDWGGDDAAPPILGERPAGDESTATGPTSE